VKALALYDSKYGNTEKVAQVAGDRIIVRGGLIFSCVEGVE
jgi:hypothetical protein